MNDLLMFPERLKYRIFRDPISMRCSFKGLGDLVERHLGKSGKDEKIVFFFFNRKGDGVKGLYYDKRARHIFYTLLDEEEFSLPVFDKDQKTIDLDTVTLMALLQGLKLFSARSA